MTDTTHDQPAAALRLLEMRDRFTMAQPDKPDTPFAALTGAAELITDLTGALQTIIDWADFAMRNPGEFNSHGVRNLDGPAFDTARDVLAKATAR